MLTERTLKSISVTDRDNNAPNMLVSRLSIDQIKSQYAITHEKCDVDASSSASSASIINFNFIVRFERVRRMDGSTSNAEISGTIINTIISTIIAGTNPKPKHTRNAVLTTCKPRICLPVRQKHTELLQTQENNSTTHAHKQLS